MKHAVVRAFILSSSLKLILCKDKQLLMADKMKPNIKLLFHKRGLSTIRNHSSNSSFLFVNYSLKPGRDIKIKFITKQRLGNYFAKVENQLSSGL
jgi:hypothetical protein